ncbi:MAG: glycosyltransferase [Candidatus Njordarchaeia archaeon]
MKRKGLFIAWRVLSTRSEPIAKCLNFQLFFVKDKPPYLKSIVKTFIKILKKKPNYVAIQLPQGPLLFLTALLKKLFRFLLIADVHTYFLLPVTLKEKLLNQPFIPYLKDCDIILVHNYELKKFLPADLKKKTMVLRDLLPEIKISEKTYKKTNEVILVFPASFAHDEPIENLIRAFKRIKKPKNITVKLYITGNWKQMPDLKRKYSSKDIIFTGYLSRRDYLKLINKADVLLALTIYQYTWQSAATEALALGKPLILSRSKALMEVFTEGVIYVDCNNLDSIKTALERIIDPAIREKLQNEMQQLRRIYQAEISQKIKKLKHLIAISNSEV